MLAALLVAFVVQCLAWAWVGAGLRRVRDDAPLPEAEAPAPPLPISVVVAAHNEAERLPSLLDALAAQTHRGSDGGPGFEVVIVDDRSTDRTAALVRWRMDDFPVPLRLVQVAEGAPHAAGLPPKKHALERGVEAAAHDRIAFTDADGRPGPEWLATLARFAAPDGIDDGAVLVGYGPLVAEGGWLNRFARYETVQTAVLAAASVGWGVPWQAVGRNFSYPKTLLARLGGFEHSAASLSGDDDLLLQEVGRTGEADVRYVWDAAGAVPSPAPPDAGAFLRQKRRHASAGAHYPTSVLLALWAFHLSGWVLWFGTPAFHLLTGLPYGWGLLAGKLLLQRSVLGDALGALGDEPDLRLWQPVLDLAAVEYHALVWVLGLLPTPTRW